MLVWHPAHPIREWGCVDLSMNTMHLKDPLVLFGFEDSALPLLLFLLSHAFPLFFNNDKGLLYENNLYAPLNGLMYRCAFKAVMLVTHSQYDNS